MISVLIPTFNYNVFPLVKSLHEQLTAWEGDYEIIVYDDHSTQPLNDNRKINELVNASYTILDQNIGRSAIRNKLAMDAKNEFLLFLDADTQVISETFITTYIKNIDEHTGVIYGGIVYQKELPPPDELLRWVYGNTREALSVEERNKNPHLRFLTLNFLIKKSVFQKIRFNEEIPNLRHEDTLFAMDAKKNQVRVIHIDNPVVHLGLESSEVFLRKSRESVEALVLFMNQSLIDVKEVALTKKAHQLKALGLAHPSKWMFQKFKERLERNLLSAKPSLFLFDLYRLGYYFTLKPENDA